MQGKQKLGLGGHTFIAELGNDPQATFEEQCGIVSACLDQGIQLIDTTYYQERVALGNILAKLKRREEAVILAWNFFKQLNKEHELVEPTIYEPFHIDIMLEELQTDYIDILVIHINEDPKKMQGMLDLASLWIAEGKIKKAALGMAKLVNLKQLQKGHPISYILIPYNAFNQGALEVFREARQMGISNIALSPFVRGWKLDEIGKDKLGAADILLRWVAANELVDYIIVSMRKKGWVKDNMETVQRGRLMQEEIQKLQGWIEQLS